MSCHRDLETLRAGAGGPVTPQHGGGPTGSGREHEMVYSVPGALRTVGDATLQHAIASLAPKLAETPGSVLVIKAASDGLVVADVRSEVGEHGPVWMVHDHRTGIRYLRTIKR